MASSEIEVSARSRRSYGKKWLWKFYQLSRLGSCNKTVFSLGSAGSAGFEGSAVPRSAAPQISLTPVKLKTWNDKKAPVVGKL